jgi:hypothetical protein
MGKKDKDASGVEVTEINERGVELLLDSRTVFMSYREFPWFKEAPARHVRNVQRPHVGHLHWPDLDVDLEEASLFEPEKYPLIFGSSPGGPDTATKGRKKTR